MAVPALALFMRFVITFITNGGRTGHVQSLIAGAVLFNAAMLLVALGVIGDLLAAQRTLSQRTFERVRRIELQLGIAPSHYEPASTAAAQARQQPGSPGGVNDGPADREALEV
jgi:hypothetical protein